MFRTPTPKSPSQRLDEIKTGLSALGTKSELSERECWQAIDLMQQFADVLPELGEEPGRDETVICRLDGETTIKWKSADAMATWITKVMQ